MNFDTHELTLTLCLASSIAKAFVNDVIPPYKSKPQIS